MRVIKSYEVDKIRDLFMDQTVTVIGPASLMLGSGLTVEVEPWEADCWCGEGNCEITWIAGFEQPVEYTLILNDQCEHSIFAAFHARGRLLLKVEGGYGHHDTGYDLVVR